MGLRIEKELLNLESLDPTKYGELGFMTSDIPGVGGTIKDYPEDFEVEEIPAYLPSGEGEHLFLWIEKRNLSSDEMVTRISRALNIPSSEIGVAGKKDRVAVTKQFVSIPKKAEANLTALDDPCIMVHSCTPHTNKLVVGHNRGNKFQIKIRNIRESTEESITQIAHTIQAHGFANFYGPQRFGSKGDTADIGFKILRGETADLPKQWLNKGKKKFALSAAQSYLYNRYLLRRLVELGQDSLLLGDVVFKSTGGIFKVDDLEAERARFMNKEINPAGPIFGKKTYASSDEAADFEEKILSEAGIDRSVFQQFGKMMMGTRRANICRPDAFSWTLEGDTLELAFTLPSGSYATVLLAEFMKPLSINGE